MFWFLVSPRVLLAVFCIIACVISSENKRYTNERVEFVRTRIYSEKDNGIVASMSVKDVTRDPADLIDLDSDEEPGEGNSDPLIVRRQRKAAITRHLGSLARHVAEGNAKRIQQRLIKMQKSFDIFEVINNAHMKTLTDDKDLEDSESWFSEVENRYIAGVKAARKWLKENVPDFDAVIQNPYYPVGSGTVPADTVPGAAGPANTSATAVPVADNTDVINMLSIPKLKLDPFSGDPLEYPSFIAIFDDSVANKVSDDQVKLTCLLQYTTGPAKAAIRNCSLTGGSKGYARARDILQKRFGNNQLVSRKIINDLVNGKPVSKPADIRQLSDDLDMALSALESRGMTYEIDNQRTIQDILNRFPKPIQTKWRNKALDIREDTDTYPDFRTFVEFMCKMARHWCDPVYGGDVKSSNASNSRPKVSSVNTFSAESNASTPPSVNAGVKSSKCAACDLDHRLIYCATFKAMTPANRVQLARDKRLCFNCLLPNHVAAKCKRQFVCSVPDCGKRHSKFLHSDVLNPNMTGQSQSSTAVNNVNSGSTSAFGTSVYLPIVPLLVNGVQTYGLLDNGSTNSFITGSLAKRLKLNGPQYSYAMRTVNSVKPMSSKVVNVNVSAADGSFCQELKNVLVNSTAPAKYPTEEIDIKKYPHLANVPLFPIQKGTLVEVVIGMDNSHLLLPLEVRYNADALHEPYATRTVFGWALHGNLGDNTLGEIAANFIQLDHKVERIWEMENDIDDKSYSIEDTKVIDLWDREIKRENGHYVLPIPWRKGCADLPNNRFVAQCRLESLTKRLHRTGLTEIYNENIQKMLDCGYAERVPQNELCLNDGTIWYIPHHPVLNKPGKVRPVFDCSARYKGISLNSECMQGPNLTNNLVNVLLRFRQYPYAVLADIESMYLQIRIPESDRNALRFLWYDKLDGAVVEYRMTSHLFGGIWCASSSAYALRRTVLDCQPSPLIEQTILKSFYVDDMLKSVQNIEQASEIIHGTSRVLEYGGFNLTKFIVNDSKLLEQISVENRAKEIKDIVPDVYCKALGIRWDVNHDTFHYQYKDDDMSVNINRRQMLSRTMSMYDPLGLIAPIILRGKLLFQEATRLKLTWDEPVPVSLRDNWHSWFKSMKNLESLKFDRCLVPCGFENGVFEIHNFCDASNTGFGACSYIRVINKIGNVHVALVASKGRMAPIKQTTIPRLELSAAVIAVKLDVSIRNELEIPLIKSYFWTDSQIVLAYLHNETKRSSRTVFLKFGTIVTRLNGILCRAHRTQLMYCLGDAQLITYLCSGSKVQPFSLITSVIGQKICLRLIYHVMILRLKRTLMLPNVPAMPWLQVQMTSRRIP